MVNHKNHIKISGSDNYAGNPLVQVCGGAVRQRTALPGNFKYEILNYSPLEKGVGGID